MALHRLRDFDPNYREHFENQDVIGYDLYSGDDKIGTVDDLLVDENGQFRYFIINTGLWVFGKKVLLPVGQSRISYDDRRLYANGLSREQVENLPAYDENATVDYDYEEQVRGGYRSNVVDNMGAMAAPAAPATYDRDTYNYDRDPALFDLNERDHQNLRLYEERLIANKARQKTGDVAVGKRVTSERTSVEVPLEKERVVIERSGVTDRSQAVAPGEATFAEGEVARMEVYEEVPDIHKEAYVREEVNVRKETQRDVVTADEEIRREELDVRTEGRPLVEKRPDNL